MDSKEHFEIKRCYELRHNESKKTTLMIVLSKGKYYLAIHVQESVIAYKLITPLLAEIIMQKLFAKITNIRNQQQVQPLLVDAFKFKCLYQSLLYIQLHGMKKIFPAFITKLNNRFKIKGEVQYTIDDNYNLEYVEFEVRLPPHYELFGKFISLKNQKYFVFALAPQYKTLLSK